MDVPKDAVNSTMRCSLCDKYLNVAPVLGLCEEGSQYRCGRCKDVECVTYARNFSYEKVCKYLTFPCTYDGCEDKIPWGQVEAHEAVCPYRTVSCFVCHPDCDRSLQLSELEQHFKQVHPQRLMYNKQLIICVRVGSTNSFLLVENGLTYIVYLCISEDCPSYVGVFCLSPSAPSAKYNLELSAQNGNTYFINKNQNVVAFDERRHCLECLRNRCFAKHHPFSQLYGRQGANFQFMTTNLDSATSILDLLDNPRSVRVAVDLIEEEE